MKFYPAICIFERSSFFIAWAASVRASLRRVSVFRALAQGMSRLLRIRVWHPRRFTAAWVAKR
jgi:hypothetical protein